jgi:hypothetical protein
MEARGRFRKSRHGGTPPPPKLKAKVGENFIPALLNLGLNSGVGPL